MTPSGVVVVVGEGVTLRGLALFRRHGGVGRELAPHLLAHPLDVLLAEAPETGSRQSSSLQLTPLFEVPDCVLVHSELLSCVAHVQEFDRGHQTLLLGSWAWPL